MSVKADSYAGELENAPSRESGHFRPLGEAEPEKRVFSHGTVELYNANGELRLIPTASRDPNDPLRIPEWRKWAVLSTFCLFTVGGMTCANSIGAITPDLTVYYSQVPNPPSSQLINQLGSFPSLFIGIGAIISVIVAQGVGTRSVLIVQAAITVAGMLWSAVSNGSDRGLRSNIAARSFMSLGVGAVESVVPLMMQSLNYLHSRNSRLALIWAAGGVANSVLGTVSTYIIHALDWRWYTWILFIVTAVSFVFIVLLVPETTFPRSEADLCPDGLTDPVRPSNRGESYMYSLRLYSEDASWATAWQGTKDLARTGLFPNIIWLFLINACFIGSTISASLVFGQVLVTGYHWETRNVGLLQIPLAVGSLLSIPLVGFGSDMAIKALAKRNNGIHEPEHTLVCLVLPMVSGVVGTLCFGIFVDNPEKYHWMLPMTMTGLQYFGVNSVNVVSVTYAIECYPELAEPVVIIIGAYRNIVGFGLTYGVNGFVGAVGYKACFGAYAALTAGFFLMGLPFYLMGPRVRAEINKLPIRHGWGKKADQSL
ncbi:major facilitator superfamily domain-containing protein [Aspergillus pseudoustus]|uniref:Major facilitator superfamily domain-containing protein n=1 Tax=Aspergillus pseudoustus TaxID=1810923 RepID=A0ABR4IG49_9EURO